MSLKYFNSNILEIVFLGHFWKRIIHYKGINLA